MVTVLVPVPCVVHPPSSVAGTVVATRRLPIPTSALALVIVVLLRLLVKGEAAPPRSAWLEAGPAHEAPAGDDHAIDDLDRQPREPARRGAANDMASIPRIELRFVAWASESSRLGLPERDVTAGVRADAGIGHDAVGRQDARVLVELVRGKPHEQDLIQPRAVADDTAGRVNGIDQERRLAREQIPGADDLSEPLAAGEHEAISGLRTLRSGVTSLGGSMARRAEDDTGAEGGPQ
jgi:hypothetical protein